MKKEEFIFDQRFTGSIMIDHVSKFFGEKMFLCNFLLVKLWLFLGLAEAENLRY